MSVYGIGDSGAYAAILGGARGELKSRILSHALENAELLDANLAAGFMAVGKTAHGLTEFGIAMAKHDLLGKLFDALG